MRNNLGTETSPYLLQHQDNPVHWQAWGPEALGLAKQLNKPVLLSVGYAACHWCHVMAHESFENPEIATLMNELFINIKVDREERPDIDTIYMNALHLLGQQGGWPLTMFLTPDGEPFWGGTYFPPESRWGRPGFPDVLRQIHHIYSAEREKVETNTQLLRKALSESAGTEGNDPGAPELTLDLLDQAADHVLEHVDIFDGGLRGAPKFPQPSIFTLLWRAYARTGNRSYHDAVMVTLDRMCQGGIYDHLGGGFARYSTDAVWLVPHFEKMLYDNAQLIELLTDAWREAQNTLYATRIRETIDWVAREMIAENGAFAASLDADSEGVEGKFYVWTAAEIDDVLGSTANAFKSAYDVTAAGNWEGAAILNRTAKPHFTDDEAERGLTASRQMLLAKRDARIRPGWDDKVLADWNGLMIAALAQASMALAEPDWLDLAETAFHAVVRDMTIDGRLRHSYRAGQAKHSALLDDYANMMRAAISLYEATNINSYLEAAEAWFDIVETHYQDTQHGGYYYSADDAEALITRTRTVIDNAIPAGNGTMAFVLAKLYHLTGKDRFRASAAEVIKAFSAEARRNVLAVPTLLNGFDLLVNATQVVIVGDPKVPAYADLIGDVFRAPVTNLVFLRCTTSGALPDGHPATGKVALNNQPTVYVCVGTVCSAPITSGEMLRKTLSMNGLRTLSGR
ncbi:MAG: thioredoxin domain-containing protein [Proteobacteria bacterium]|nr:thioredoxin domain-containing protein [Pseudomonadota bacterium]